MRFRYKYTIRDEEDTFIGEGFVTVDAEDATQGHVKASDWVHANDSRCDAFPVVVLLDSLPLEEEPVPEQHTYVFVLANQDRDIYGPNGIRVALCDNWDELITDVVDLFETDLLEDVIKVTDEDLCTTLERLAPGNWSVYSAEEGYLNASVS